MTRLKMDIAKKIYDKLGDVNFNNVRFTLKSTGCTLVSGGEIEKDHHLIIEMEIAEENQMNIDNLATQTPEEKEALDLIDTTPHQYERVANKDVGWNGEGLPPVGALCKVNRDSFTYRVMYSSEYVVIVQNLDNDNTTAHGMDIILDLHKGNYTFSKPESPQQREERECLEAAYDLYCHAIDLDTPFDKFCNFGPLKDIYIKIVDKTNYRKESN